MAAAIDKAGLLFQTGYFQRGIPVHQALKDLVAQGDLRPDHPRPFCQLPFRRDA